MSFFINLKKIIFIFQFFIRLNDFLLILKISKNCFFLFFKIFIIISIFNIVLILKKSIIIL